MAVTETQELLFCLILYRDGLSKNKSQIKKQRQEQGHLHPQAFPSRWTRMGREGGEFRGVVDRILSSFGEKVSNWGQEQGFCARRILRIVFSTFPSFLCLQNPRWRPHTEKTSLTRSIKYACSAGYHVTSRQSQKRQLIQIIEYIKKNLKSYLIILPKEFEKIAENGKNQFPIILLTT